MEQAPSDLTRLAGHELAALIAAGEVSSVEATQAHLDRIAAVDGEIHAFLHVNDGALEQAKAIDERRASGEQLHELAGAPVAIKDVLCTIGMPSTSGSRILEGWVPPYDATVVARLKAAGLVALGKTNMDEFAMGSSTEHSAYGPTRNPWDTERIPGGSRGGTTAGVADERGAVNHSDETAGAITQTAPAAPAAAQPLRSPPSRRPSPSAATPAARSASRPRSPARSASSPPTAASAATARSHSPRASTRSGR